MKRFLILFFLVVHPILAVARSEDQKLEYIITEFLRQNKAQDLFWSPALNLDSDKADKADFSNLGDYYSKDFETRVSQNIVRAQSQFRKIQFALLSEQSKIDYFLFDEDLRIRSASTKIDFYKYLIFTGENRAASFVRSAYASENFFRLKPRKTITIFYPVWCNLKNMASKCLTEKEKD
jgi:hypothetical protein